eukprot:1715501-Prymnesium_polylepis.2
MLALLATEAEEPAAAAHHQLDVLGTAATTSLVGRGPSDGLARGIARCSLLERWPTLLVKLETATQRSARLRRPPKAHQRDAAVAMS